MPTHWRDAGDAATRESFSPSIIIVIFVWQFRVRRRAKMPECWDYNCYRIELDFRHRSI